MLLSNHVLNLKAGEGDITIKRKKKPTDNVVVHTENGNYSEANRNAQHIGIFSKFLFLHTTKIILEKSFKTYHSQKDWNYKVYGKKFNKIMEEIYKILYKGKR